MTLRAAAVLPAAGGGRRMGGVRKAFIELDGVPLLRHCVEAFLGHPLVHQVVVALAEEDLAAPPDWLKRDAITLVQGGSERHESVRLALAAVADDIDIVAIHDAARPLVTADLISRVIQAAADGAGAVAALPASDTIHVVDPDGRVTDTPPRDRLWAAQTPQAFPLAMIRQAHERAAADRVQGTDDAALAVRCGFFVRVVPGDAANLKITFPQDVALAQVLLRERQATPPGPVRANGDGTQ